MKKIFTILSLLAVCAMVNAQTTYHVVYIPGDGERQFGFSLAPSFCSQHLNVNASNVDRAGQFNYEVDGTVNSLMGFNAGLFYGYETQWGNFIEWGNITSLFYNITPFSSEVTFNHNGTIESHKVKYTAQHVILHVNPFISHRFSDELSVNLGLGFLLSPRFSNKASVDGVAMTEQRDFDASLLQNLFNISFDANLGVKYWFTEQWYAGLRVQYNFASLVSLFSKMDNSETEVDEVLSVANGNIRLNLDEKTFRTILINKPSIQTVLSLGYTW